MSKNVYHIGSGALTFEIIERIINENLKLELAPEAKLRIQKCRDYLDHKIASSEEPLYGITTGFGSLCTKNISPDELGTLQENLIKSHACSVGEEIRPVIIKLMMLLKAHALSLGHSGVQVITVQRILDFFNNDVMPIVYDRGSLGASGDLAPLANLFLPLIGVGDVYYKGKKCEAISVLDEFGWEPVKLMSKEGLALLNGTQFMSANGVFAMLKAFRLSKKADLIAALSLEAFDGRIDPFMDCIQQIRPTVEVETNCLIIFHESERQMRICSRVSFFGIYCNLTQEFGGIKQQTFFLFLRIHIIVFLSLTGSERIVEAVRIIDERRVDFRRILHDRILCQ